MQVDKFARDFMLTPLVERDLRTLGMFRGAGW